MYRLFYDYETNGDILFVIIDPEKKVDEVMKKGDVAYLYSKKELVGINIFEISDVVRIKSKGVIFAPDRALIAAINTILDKPLEEEKESGYEVMSIANLEEHPLDEKAKIVTLKSLNKTYQSVSYYPNLKIGMLVVVAKDGTILYNGSLFHKKLVKNIPVEVSLLSGKELKVSDDCKEAFSPEGYKEGDDFFLMSEAK